MNPRVTAAMRKAALFTLSNAATYPHTQALINDLCEAIITADDHGTRRFVIGTRDQHGNTLIYGPYPNSDAAQKAIDAGAVGISEHTTAWIFPLIPSPRPLKAPKSRSTATPNTNQPTLL